MALLLPGIKLGDAALVAPIDKLSVVLVAIFGVAFLGERLYGDELAGCGLHRGRGRPGRFQELKSDGRRSWHSARMARVRISIIFESGARIGPGKAQLLESIRDTGSISAAARDMGMSYKRAWLLLDSINQAFTEPVVTAATGGSGGGGATLTAFGVEVLERYRRVQDEANRVAADDLDVLARRARPEAGPKV